jgi:Flp pilus assembly protein CpaB
MRRFRRPRSPWHLARRIAAMLLAVGALALALRPSPALTAVPRPVLVAVAVAGLDLPAGTVLTREQVTVTRLPPSAVPSGTAADPSSLVGRVLAGSVRAGEPLTDVRLVGAGLTRSLPVGQVAAPVRLADLAVAALVHTGDRVDVLATPHDAARAETVAANALVLAADGRPHDASADPGGGLLLLAVDDATAARLAAVAASSTLTVTMPGR